MATTTVNNKQKVTSRTTTTTIYTDKCSLWLVIITGITILLTVIAGICVKFLLETFLASIIILSLICFEVLLGILVLSILAYRRKKYATTSKVVSLSKNGDYHRIQPSAPQMETSWEYSNRETLPA